LLLRTPLKRPKIAFLIRKELLRFAGLI
jgi:hypothetical protein